MKYSSEFAITSPLSIKERVKEAHIIPFATEVDTTGKVTVNSVIPEGIRIEVGPLGKKLVATQDFQHGEIVYVGYASLIDLSQGGDRYTVRLLNHDGSFFGEEILSSVHSVLDYHQVSGSKPTVRQLFGFDAFMNHSCSANMRFLSEITGTDAGLTMSYQAIAIRDILVGDELTCDYAMFDYDCDGHEIELCQCGATNCRGKMLGFKDLTLEDKVAIMQHCEPEIVQTFFEENPDVVLIRSNVPEGIDIIEKKGDSHLIAACEFEAGDIVFSNRAALISPRDLKTMNYILECNGKFYLMDNYHHFVHREEYSEGVGFDSFMDHSCCPNTVQEYTSLVDYTMRATRRILPGDRITMDYATLKSVKTVTFQCSCGSDACRGIVES